MVEAVRGRINCDWEHLAAASGGYLAAGQHVPDHGGSQFIAIFHLVILSGLGLAGDGEMRGIDLLDAGDMDCRGHEDGKALGRAQAGRPIVRNPNAHHIRAG